MTISDLVDWSIIIKGVTGIGVLVIGIWAATVTIRQLRTSATTDLYHRFNNPVAREQRRWVYRNCRRLIDSEKLSEWAQRSDDLNNLEGVCNSLDWAGLLVRKKLLNKEDAVDLYGDSLIRCWVVLHPWIDHTRKRRNSPVWLWKNFELLVKEAAKDSRFEYWIRDGVQVYDSTEKIRLDYKTSEIIDTLPLG